MHRTNLKKLSKLCDDEGIENVLGALATWCENTGEDKGEYLAEELDGLLKPARELDEQMVDGEEEFDEPED